MDKKSSAYFSHLFYNKANVNEGAAFMNRKGFMVMLGVILINTILAILVVVLGIVIKSRM